MSETVSQSLDRALEELGISRAHLVVPGLSADEALGLIEHRGDLVASLTLILPIQLVAEFAPLGDRLAAVCEASPALTNAADARTALSAIPGASVFDLPDGYEAFFWSDLAGDQGEILRHAIEAASAHAEAPEIQLEPCERSGDGVRLRVSGAGEALLLFPLGLSPTQWDPLLPELEARFTTVRVSGARIGTIGGLEQRAAGASYRAMVADLFTRLGVAAGQHLVEVGSGTGVLCRQLAITLGGGRGVTGLDVNQFFLDEARAIADEDRQTAKIAFEYGDATQLPLADASVDAIYSVTAFEECDVEAALAEMHRVLRPGGRMGVIVRATDLPHHWNLNLQAETARVVNAPWEGAGKSEGGCADRSLYERVAGRFGAVDPYAFWAATSPPLPRMIRTVAGRLDEAQAQEFRLALAEEAVRHTAYHAMPYHCAVATKG